MTAWYLFRIADSLDSLTKRLDHIENVIDPHSSAPPKQRRKSSRNKAFLMHWNSELISYHLSLDHLRPAYFLSTKSSLMFTLYTFVY